MGPLTEWASIRGKISHERRVSCPRSRVCCTTIIVTLTKKFRRKNSFFKIKATGPGVVYFVWKNVSCTYFLFNRALSSLRSWNSIIPFLTTFEKKNKNQEHSLMLLLSIFYCKEHLVLKSRNCEKATKFEKISQLFWRNSCFYPVASKQVGVFFKKCGLLSKVELYF